MPEKPGRRSRAAALYHLLLGAMPPDVTESDRAEMVFVLEDQLADADSQAQRTSIVLRAFSRLPLAIVREWMEAFGVGATRRGGGRINNGEGLGEMLRNIRFTLRTLRRNPTFALTTMLLVGLGVGAVTTVFTVVDHVLLRPLPYPEAERLVTITQGSHSGPVLREIHTVEAFEVWTATSVRDVNLSRNDGAPLRLRMAEATPEFFTIYGARPALGRVLVEADYEAPNVVVLTHDAWTSVWGADPAVVGRTIRIDGDPLLVVGVLEEGFVEPEATLGRAVQMFEPLPWDDPALQEPGHHRHDVVARLHVGATAVQADAELLQVAERVAELHPDYYQGEARPKTVMPLQEYTVRGTTRGLWLLLGAVGLLLLVACANVAHLFMARGLARGREMAIRRAMGAGTRALSGQLLIESLAVGVLGAVLGLVLAQLGLTVLQASTDALPRGDSIGLDLRVLLFSMGLASLTALVFGMLPALRTVGRDINDTLRQSASAVSSGKRTNFVRGGLVVGEVAMSLVLVALAGLLMRSFSQVTNQDTGFGIEDRWVVALNLEGIETPQQYLDRLEPIRQALVALPEVEAVNYGFEGPFDYTGGGRCCWSGTVSPAEGEEPYRISYHATAPYFFDVFGTELVAGRAWTEHDVPAEPVPVVVNEDLAVRAFGSAERALGQMVEEGMTVIGVAESTLHYGLDQDHGAAVYFPMENLAWAFGRASVGLKVTGAGEGFGTRVREAIWSVEPNLPVPSIESLESKVHGSSSTRRMSSMIFGAFGIIALMLAAGGLYGTLLYAVGERRKELGIRLALGAGRRRIQTEVVRRGLVMAALGVGAGLVGAWYAGRLVESFLFGVTASDVWSLATAAIVLLGTAAAASWVPAFRASRTDPLETLKAE